MPIQFDSLFSFKSPDANSATTKLLSNPFYTAALITFIFVIFLYIFSPLKNDKFNSYFRLFLYFGVFNSIVLFFHNNFIIRIVEKKYEAEEIDHEQIKVQPQLVTGADEVNKELDDLSEELTRDIGEEMLEIL